MIWQGRLLKAPLVLVECLDKLKKTDHPFRALIQYAIAD